MGVRLCSSARPANAFRIWEFEIFGFSQVSGQPLTAAWLCFILKYGCLAPIAANAHVSGSATTDVLFQYNQTIENHFGLSLNLSPV